MKTRIALCVLVCLWLGKGGQARENSVGGLSIPFSPGSTAVSDPRSAAAMPGGCLASASSDFAYRNGLPQYPIPNADSRWGPHLIFYPEVTADQVPPQCNPTAWAWERVQSAIAQTIALDLNYCHHHAPGYVTPPAYQVVCDPLEAGVDGAACVCNKAGMYKTNAWAGLDCSNYVAWIYNYAFGYCPTSAIGAQACSSKAPGRLLDTIGLSNLDGLNPGDLVFITLGKAGRTAPVRVSHVVLWTGWTVDFTPGAAGPLANATLVANLPRSQISSAVACMTSRQQKRLPVYVISDSTHTGPNLRPFCGWYMSSFSHARRVINPDVAAFPDVNDRAIAYYATATDNCMSMWALQR